MSTKKRLNRTYQNALVVPFDNTSKFVLVSDCHRGDNSFADDFANNRNIYYHALKNYYINGFTYCELGDGDELWENRNFSAIFHAHRNVFGLLKKFYQQNRLLMIWGNHDMYYRDERYVKKHLHHYFDEETGKQRPLFEGIKYHEGIILKHTQTHQELFLLHGHQADWWNYRFWKLSMFLVRALWKPLQIVGISDPTSPAKNHKELIKVERRIKKWIIDHDNVLTISGHTHRPRFPEPGNINYFNDGSCVHPRSITAIEIEAGAISLVKWYINTTEEGVLQIVKTVLEGPQPLIDFIDN